MVSSVGCLVRMGEGLMIITGFGGPVVIVCRARGEDARVGSGGRVCLMGFFEGHGGDGGGVL